MDSVVAGEPLAPPGAFEQARNEARVREAYEAQRKQAQRWRAELATEEAALRRLEQAEARGSARGRSGVAASEPVEFLLECYGFLEIGWQI